MTLSIELDPITELKLVAAAKREGVTVEEYALRCIIESLDRFDAESARNAKESGGS